MRVPMFPISSTWKLTCDWAHMRPYSAPPEKKTHPHAAWDLGVPSGTEIHAPEDGLAYYLYQLRTGRAYHDLFWDDDKKLAFRNYFYDTFGGCIFFQAESYTYLFSHVYGETIFRWLSDQRLIFEYTEHKVGDVDIYSWWNATNPLSVYRGDLIGHSGNSGFSTGPHVHMEMHFGRDFTVYKNRPDPKDIFPEEWEKHKDD